ncbi:VOC family protein [Arthrobacter castelli]|uniref:VOC family protein n=1 Tax=Arthrobacter castelli TaxID=271431 RepID=UPI000478C339|nr:VOC family protein [Arthrobacter castelli]
MASVQVRYIVRDVDEGLAFYTTHLGFHEDMHPAPAFAMLSRGPLRLVLNASSPEGVGGGSVLSDGSIPEPGGWNRFGIETDDLDGTVERLRGAGVAFRGEVIEGTGVRQAIIEDPSGNPVELFEPRRPEARLTID